ncbi:hypothetical protein [Plantactinospora sp. KBS50]|uniref:hypothetical protein n=1 Tax=Plantactinospora sp. KBS50 TaxID=2024580 RepID=UPI000BAAF434|nr:hypothetical protein [Plantactinospora sp. KBS50]ASW53002.1 hypothetical protein CIK06_00575 [Plantactinospora sp. KBS50]
MVEDQILEPAGTTYKDWLGSAAAEDSFIKGAGNLYKLAGLDHDKWSILAIDVYTFSHGAPSDWQVSVYAVDRANVTPDNYDGLKALEAEQGSVPVTEFKLDNVSLEDVVRCMKVMHVQLTRHNFRRLNIVDRANFPPQD